MKIALLSNINLNPVNRLLSKNMEVYENPGYGNELGILMNPDSSIYSFNPEVIFVIEDIMELLNHDLEKELICLMIDKWFSSFERSIQKEKVYYVSDAYVWGAEMEICAAEGIKVHIEELWQRRLEQCKNVHHNVRIFPYRALIEKIGESHAFSTKMWYMGKILHTSEVHNAIYKAVLRQVTIESYVPKKVLLLDLDNTLWGGLAGEHDTEAIKLSDDGMGLAYKNLQRVILQMKKQGVILGIVSKNNENDAKEILLNHPHMVLKPHDFVIQKINWQPKHENILQIADELNLGLDSMVFYDDSPAERKIVKDFLPQVVVPDFSARPEELAYNMAEIYRKYFEKPYITDEDKKKTLDYHANEERKKLKDSVNDFNEYLKNLNIRLVREDSFLHSERVVQLINKTNQFNLTTKRLQMSEVEQILNDDSFEMFVYRVTDSFGDNGIVAVAIVEYTKEPKIIEFIMSCRVMGRRIENAIIEDIERSARNRGYKKLYGIYAPTAKNRPVLELYPSLGYKKIKEDTDGSVLYEMDLEENVIRNYQLERK